ncbi:ATP-grasp domain-containing protein [Kineosporia sp. NBRC 101731]|uniref:ATP-grasp domain-containing protein n=1 Tax=Kineosporia sp. NBRC 101731 TaxID=3032199 RepID=UPI0024A3D958|nr:ATP-grasp domain-containing protein [Kineosporia sp. NBRC 101731]GLY30444.1 argininosuccinate lyase [Kineosporia sp. NBRC 101731]
MTAPAVLLIDATGPDAERLMKAAADRRFTVHAATSHDHEQAARLVGVSGAIAVDFAQPDRAVAEIVEYGRRHRIEAVLTFNEYLTVVVAQVCAALGLPGNDPNRAPAARDKEAMATALTRAGVRVPATVVLHDQHDLRERQVATPCVVKPASGAGSAGVTVVTASADLPAAVHAARSARGMYGNQDRRVLIQPLIMGREYSVESVVQDGVARHLTVTRKTVTGYPHRVETAHQVPAVLAFDQQRVLDREAERAIRAVGIRNGAAHTELILGPDGTCTVIEIGARLAAGQIGLLLRHALAIDIYTVLLDIALGRPAAVQEARGGHALVRSVTAPEAGRLIAVEGLPAVGPGVPYVRQRFNPGDRVTTAVSNRDRVAEFVVAGTDPVEVEERAEKLADQIRVMVRPESGLATSAG